MLAKTLRAKNSAGLSYLTIDPKDEDGEIGLTLVVAAGTDAPRQIDFDPLDADDVGELIAFLQLRLGGPAEPAREPATAAPDFPPPAAKDVVVDGGVGIPSVLYDGHAVFMEMRERDPHSVSVPVSVSDVLDAVVRILKREQKDREVARQIVAEEETP